MSKTAQQIAQYLAPIAHEAIATWDDPPTDLTFEQFFERELGKHGLHDGAPEDDTEVVIAAADLNLAASIWRRLLAAAAASPGE